MYLGGDSIDILGLAQFCAQVMFGVLRHVSASSALLLNLAQFRAQFSAQFRAQFCAQDFKCVLNRPPDPQREKCAADLGLAAGAMKLRGT